jgi:hypothetical protein
MPAAHFETKKAGKNTGLWCRSPLTLFDAPFAYSQAVYRCQKPQHTQCKFFLWDSDAKAREQLAVMSNSRSEIRPQQETPTRPRSDVDHTDPLPSNRTPVTSPSSHRAQARAMREEEFEDSDLLDEDLEMAVSPPRVSRRVNPISPSQQQGHQPMPPPETPRKAAKTSVNMSPGRWHREGSPSPALPTSRGGDDPHNGPNIFTTPSTSRNVSHNLFADLFPDSGLPTPQTHRTTRTGAEWGSSEAATPATPSRFRDVGLASGGDSTTATDVFEILQEAHIRLPPEVEADIKTVLNTQAKKTEGILKGRDISRLNVKAKEAKIKELRCRIETLEADREVHRSILLAVRNDLQADL